MVAVKISCRTQLGYSGASPVILQCHGHGASGSSAEGMKMGCSKTEYVNGDYW